MRHRGQPAFFDVHAPDAEPVQQVHVVRRDQHRHADRVEALEQVHDLEREIGIPIYDTIATAVWASLRTVGVHPGRVKGWGRLFREVK